MKYIQSIHRKAVISDSADKARQNAKTAKPL